MKLSAPGFDTYEFMIAMPLGLTNPSIRRKGHSFYLF